MRHSRKTVWDRVFETVAASKPGSWFALNVANPIDKRLLPATKGRISLSIGQPVLCLEVPGAKSGIIRRTPVLFFDVDGALVLVASATGVAKHPAWYHNTLAAGRVKVYAPGGRTGWYKAHQAHGDERDRYWEAARDRYAGFDVYEQRTTGIREIPVVVLTRD